MLDVLGLLAVADGLLELLDEEGGRGRLDLNLSLTVGNDQLDSDADSLPLLGVLDDVVTDLLRGHTEGSDLRGQDRGRGSLATVLTQVHQSDGVRVELRSHFD